MHHDFSAPDGYKCFQFQLHLSIPFQLRLTSAGITLDNLLLRNNIPLKTYYSTFFYGGGGWWGEEREKERKGGRNTIGKRIWCEMKKVCNRKLQNYNRYTCLTQQIFPFETFQSLKLQFSVFKLQQWNRKTRLRANMQSAIPLKIYINFHYHFNKCYSQFH